MKKLITRGYLKDLLIQWDKDLEENINLQVLFSSKLRLEKDKEKRKDALATLEELEEIQSFIRENMEGISNLLDLNVIEIIIEEGDVQDI